MKRKAVNEACASPSTPSPVPSSWSRDALPMGGHASAALQELAETSEALLPAFLPFKRSQLLERYPKGQARGRHWKHLKQIIQAENFHLYPPNEPNYINIEAPPSMYPPKKYCDISGFECARVLHELWSSLKSLQRLNSLYLHYKGFEMVKSLVNLICKLTSGQSSESLLEKLVPKLDPSETRFPSLILSMPHD